MSCSCMPDVMQSSLPCLKAEQSSSSPPCLKAEQSSSKRCRVDAADRLSDLPACLLHNIISSLGSRQAVQTSVLSRRWRHLWRDVPCVAIDEHEFPGDRWEPFEDFADHMLTSIPQDTLLKTFRLHLVPCGGYSFDNKCNTAGRWIRRGLRHFPAVVDIRAAFDSNVHWPPTRSDLSVGRQQPDLSFTASFTCRLMTLRLVGVKLMAEYLKDLGRHCPALQELHIERCQIPQLSTVTSHTLRSLVVTERSVPCVHLTIVAPRLSYLRLEIFYHGGGDCHCSTGEAAPEPEPLTSLAEASIRLTETFRQQRGNRERRKRKLEFLKSMHRFLGLLLNVTKLHLTGFTTTALLDEESQEFPRFHSLKTLLLQECDAGLKFQALTAILQNTRNLENLALHHCKFLARPDKKQRKRGTKPSKGRTTTPPVFWCKNLKSIEIKRRQEDAPNLVEVLSLISEGMQLVWWLQVKISTTVVT